MKNKVWSIVFDKRFENINECILFSELFRRNLKHSNLLDKNEVKNLDFSFPDGISTYSKLLGNLSSSKNNTPVIISRPQNGYWTFTHTTLTGHTKLSIRIYSDFATLHVYRNFDLIERDYEGVSFPRKPEALQHAIKQFESRPSEEFENSISNFDR